MRQRQLTTIHSQFCQCGVCDPTPPLTQRFVEAAEPGDLQALSTGVHLSIAIFTPLLAIKFLPPLIDWIGGLL